MFASIFAQVKVLGIFPYLGSPGFRKDYSQGIMGISSIGREPKKTGEKNGERGGS